MKHNLILVRHAKSSWDDSSLNDFDRPLNSRGFNDAPMMGNVLGEMNILSDSVVTSPAIRAKETCRILSSKINFPFGEIIEDKRIYDASVNELLGIINSIDENINSLMLFGHNPGLTELNNYLSNKNILNIPTCGIVILESEKAWVDFDENCCSELKFIYPKLFKQN